MAIIYIAVQITMLAGRGELCRKRHIPPGRPNENGIDGNAWWERVRNSEDAKLQNLKSFGKSLVKASSKVWQGKIEIYFSISAGETGTRRLLIPIYESHI